MKHAAVFMFAVGCATIPVRSASGYRVRRIMISEELALMAHQPAQIELSGAELAPAVELLDKSGVLRVTQERFASYWADGSSLVLVIETTNGYSYAIQLSNCPEPHVCGFMRDAKNAGLIERVPETCQMRGLMCEGTCNLDCDKIKPSEPLAPECYDIFEPLQCADYLACKPVTAAGGGTIRKPDGPFP